jgi:hypothetical protein
MPLRRALEVRKLSRGYAVLHLRERRVGVDTLRHKACPPVLHLSVKKWMFKLVSTPHEDFGS